MFERELEFFISHQADLVAKYEGQVLLLRGDQVVGAFESALDAYTAGSEQFPLGSFMIQPCSEGPSAYTVTLASHEVFG